MINAKIILLLAFAFCNGVIPSIKAEESKLSAKDICSLMPRGVTILRPNSCTNWVKCQSSPDANDYEEGSCVYGLYYNKDEGVCQSSIESDCPFETQPKNRCASEPDGTFLPDRERCNGYIYCENGQEKHSVCPNNLNFHPIDLQCVYPETFKCPKKNEQKHADPICLSVREGIFFADEHDCVQFHECKDNTLLTHECDDGLAFDYAVGKCVLQANVTCHPKAKAPEPELTICGTKEKPFVGYLPDEESCSHYYICSQQANGPDRKPKHMKCQTGYFFDANTWSCRDRVNVQCKLDRCEGMDNKYVNVPGDCTAYARCNNGVSMDRGNCPANYYFDERTQGCTPQIISYIACAA